jgi:hypothetical protein
MIARFRILLPFTLSIPCYDELPKVHFQHDEYEVTVFPPMRANVDSSVCDITSTMDHYAERELVEAAVC